MQFDDQFFTAIGLESLDDSQKQELGMQLGELVQQRLAVRLAEVLTDEQADTFSNKMDAGQDVAAFEYLEQVYPQYADIMAEEVERAKQELMVDMQAVAEHIDKKQ